MLRILKWSILIMKYTVGSESIQNSFFRFNLKWVIFTFLLLIYTQQSLKTKQKHDFRFFLFCKCIKLVTLISISIQNCFSVLLWKHDVQLSLGHFPCFLQNCGLYSCGFSVWKLSAVNLMSVLYVWRLWQKQRTVQTIKHLATSVVVTSFWALLDTRQCRHIMQTPGKKFLCAVQQFLWVSTPHDKWTELVKKRCAPFFDLEVIYRGVFNMISQRFHCHLQ